LFQTLTTVIIVLCKLNLMILFISSSWLRRQLNWCWFKWKQEKITISASKLNLISVFSCFCWINIYHVTVSSVRVQEHWTSTKKWRYWMSSISWSIRKYRYTVDTCPTLLIWETDVSWAFSWQVNCSLVKTEVVSLGSFHSTLQTVVQLWS